MAGLFTLDSETLGVLDTNVLGGPGTGFVVGSNSSQGTATGAQGFAGVASGATSSAGSATGAAGFTGTVAGASQGTGTVVGVEGARGSVAGISTSTGTVIGTEGARGSVSGTSQSTGAAAGTPNLTGTTAGFTVNGGAVAGSAQIRSPARCRRRRHRHRRLHLWSQVAGRDCSTQNHHGLSRSHCQHQHLLDLRKVATTATAWHAALSPPLRSSPLRRPAPA